MKPTDGKGRTFSGLNPLVLKSISMKLRHRAHKVQFSRVADTSMGTEPLLHDDSRATYIMLVKGPSNLLGLKTIFASYFSILLLAVPLGSASGALGWGAEWTFWLNFAALVPLAKILGDATEELSASIGNDVITGLLNATFGNAVELIVSIQAIRAGALIVVKASLLGSVLSNVLLVLGMAFFFGGLTPSKTQSGQFHTNLDKDFRKRCVAFEKEQKFAVKSAMVSVAMMLFSCMSFALPTVFDALPSTPEKDVLTVSRIGATICMSSYVAYLIFQLITHKGTLQKEESDLRSPTGNRDDHEGEIDDEVAAGLTMGCAVSLMFAMTIVVSFSSDYLVDALQEVVQTSGISEAFIGVILLPIAGNACEHAAAIRFSMHDRPGLALGIAVGSSTQVGMFVIPFSVIFAWIIGRPLDLNFGTLNAAVMLMSMLVLLALIMDGRSNWFKGYVLCCLYMFIATMYWYTPPMF